MNRARRIYKITPVVEERQFTGKEACGLIAFALIFDGLLFWAWQTDRIQMPDHVPMWLNEILFIVIVIGGIKFMAKNIVGILCFVVLMLILGALIW